MGEYLITTDSEKCIGCHRCINGCPIVDANVAVEENGMPKIHVDRDKCIHCGRCFKACHHDARVYADDTEVFFRDLKSGKKISIIAAPSIQTNFPVNYRKFFGYLKSLGVNNIYDVSLGADITTWAYLKHIRENKMEALISQPCPTIVNYIEKYQPMMIRNLAPVQSPMMCTAIYMKFYKGITDTIGAISPCIAKKDEFMDPNTHRNIAYNVTFRKIEDYISQNDIAIESYPEVGFDSIEAELGTLFARPGGLKENVEYHFRSAWVRQVEGSDTIFNYLNEYSERIEALKVVPLVVDILNCEKGCNHGTGAREHISIDDIDLIMHQRKLSVENTREGLFNKKKELYSYFDRNLDVSKFSREYADKSMEAITATEDQIQMIFLGMLKAEDLEQHIDCSACGYKSCRDMAVAITRGINQKTNCINYNKKMVEIEMAELAKKTFELETILRKLGMVTETSEALREYNQKLMQDSTTDLLTGIFNRRYITRKLEEETERANYLGKTFSVLMIDIDHFKKVNDNYGHDAGDYVLVEVAKVMTSVLREHDIIARWGGEEFLCFLPETTAHGAFNLAERVRKIIEQKEFNYKDRVIEITLTIGVSEFAPTAGIGDALRKADLAMYRGKNNGRNCTVLG